MAKRLGALQSCVPWALTDRELTEGLKRLSLVRIYVGVTAEGGRALARSASSRGARRVSPLKGCDP
jgi:hypothetical protein